MPSTVRLTQATLDDVTTVADLRAAAAARLTRDFGRGHWSSSGTEAGVVTDLRTPGLFVVRRGQRVVGTLRLATRKQWPIDPSFFTAVRVPLYLTSMVVDPEVQRTGVGRACMIAVMKIARGWPADAVRLDAYDAVAGAGGFYEKCGFREMGRVTYRKVPLIYYDSLV